MVVEAIAVSVAGKVVSKLLEQVMEATKIAIRCNKYCNVLHALLKGSQPLVLQFVSQISESNSDNAFKRPRTAVHDWVDELEGTLKRAEVEVNECITQQPGLNIWARYNTGKRILDVTESVKNLLQQAGVVGLALTSSEFSPTQKIEEMMQELKEMVSDLRVTALQIQSKFATVTRESLEKEYTPSRAQEITSDIKSALHDLFQNLSLGPSDNMSRVDTGASSSSSCPRELIVNEDKPTDIQQVPQRVFGLDDFTRRLQESITSSSSDAEHRCVGVWGMGGAGKTLLAQIAYNSREVREHFKEGKLIWLTVSQTPNIKGLNDSFWRQLDLEPMRFAQQEEYKTRLYNEFLSRRVFLVLDDVWNKEVLEQLDLAKGPGSVTLVTTRIQPVLENAGVIDEDEVKVGFLSKDDSRKLFCVHAFSRGFSNIPPELQGVAELVIDECKCLPLALKVIGGSMVGKTMPPQWEHQLKYLRESRELPGQQEEEALFGRLKLSYNNLDNDNPVSKECFLGFAAFPEDTLVPMETLIVLWKAQGLLDDPTNMSGDDPIKFAYSLVGLLIARSLIEVDLSEYSPFRCKVHDVMRDLALHIIERQKPITCLYKPGKALVKFPTDWIQRYKSQLCEVRKLSLMMNDLTTLNGVTFSAPKLQVLLLARNEKLEAMPKQFLKGIENLKVLDLSGCDTLKSLPKQIGNLRQLIHLDLHFCEELNSLPKEVGKLTQLIYLDLSNCPNLKYLPSTMGDLRSLQYLNLVGGASNGLWRFSWKLYGQAFAVDICKLTALTELSMTGKTCEIVELCNQLSKLVSKLVKLKMFRNWSFVNWKHCQLPSNQWCILKNFGYVIVKGSKVYHHASQCFQNSRC